MIKTLHQYFLPFAAAVLTTSVLGSVFSTQRILHKLNDVGADIAMADNLGMTAYDVHHFGSLYAVFTTIAFLVALPVALWFARKFGLPKLFILGGAGAAAMIVMLFSMKEAFFGTHIVAGASDAVGLSFQALAGLIGASVFYKLRTAQTD